MHILQFAYRYTSEIGRIHNGQNVSSKRLILNAQWSKAYAHCDVNIYKSVGKSDFTLHWISNDGSLISNLTQSYCSNFIKVTKI